jgi:hypothetical protein
MVTLRSLKVGTLLGVMRRAISKRRQVADHAKVSFEPNQTKLTIVGNGGPIPHQVDGDYLGEADRLVIEHQRNSLKLVAPRQAGPPL